MTHNWYLNLNGMLLTYDEFQEAFIAWLKKYAQARGHLNEEGDVIIRRLAEDMRLSPQAVGNWLHGRSMPSIEVFHTSICGAANIDPEQLMREITNLSQRAIAVSEREERKVTARELIGQYNTMSDGEKKKVQLMLLEQVKESLMGQESAWKEN
jgi:transcriptional regulator with XRE-family HTH domain